jgi:general secretion pathway protein C
VLTLAIWALAAGSAAYWALRHAGNAPTGPMPAQFALAAPGGETGHVARLFGPAIGKPSEAALTPQVVDPSSRFALAGVVATRSSTGVAVLSVEGKPARPYRVGSMVDAGYTLKSVTAHSATLSVPRTGASFTVKLSAANAPPPIPPAAPGAYPLPRGAPATAASSAQPSS